MSVLQPLSMIAQLSDPHIVVGRHDRGSAAALSAAVETVVALRPRPSAVLITGDLAEHGAAPEYQRVSEILAALPMPVHVVAGNHDDNDVLNAHLRPDSVGTDTDVRYQTHCGPLRLLVCDTTIPGRDDGSLHPERLNWLETQLAHDRQTPTIVAMHHPPLLTGIRPLDEHGLPHRDRHALLKVLRRCGAQTVRIIAGHAHRTVFGNLQGRSVFVCPSVHLQARLELGSKHPVKLVNEPAALALHVAVAGELTTHVQPIRTPTNRGRSPSGSQQDASAGCSPAEHGVGCNADAESDEDRPRERVELGGYERALREYARELASS